MAVTVTVPPSTTQLIALADLKAVLGNIIQHGSDAGSPVLQPSLRAAYRAVLGLSSLVRL